MRRSGFSLIEVNMALLVVGLITAAQVIFGELIPKRLALTNAEVIASKVADRVGVTRSVIVNALRKLESAGIIESRSLGMKGTFIKVLSPLFVEELGVLQKD